MNTRVLIWTAFCLIMVVLTIRFIRAERFYTGNDITLTTNSSYQLVINAELVTIEAASSVNFLLRSSEGEIIEGIPAEKPLGWSNKEYYQAKPRNVYSRIWIVESGRNITVHLSSVDNIAINVSLQSSVRDAHTFLTSLCMLFAWLLGLWLITRIKFTETK